MLSDTRLGVAAAVTRRARWSTTGALARGRWLARDPKSALGAADTWSAFCAAEGVTHPVTPATSTTTVIRLMPAPKARLVPAAARVALMRTVIGLTGIPPYGGAHRGNPRLVTEV